MWLEEKWRNYGDDKYLLMMDVKTATVDARVVESTIESVVETLKGQ